MAKKIAVLGTGANGAAIGADLTRAGLDDLDCHGIRPETVQKLDAVESIPDLREVGRHVAEKVSASHFAGFQAG